MKITIYPVAGVPGAPDDVVSVAGDIITVNGTPYDLSSVPEGGEATAPEDGSHPFIGKIARTLGVLHVGLRYSYDRTTAEAHQPTALQVVDCTAGTMADPITRKPA